MVEFDECVRQSDIHEDSPDSCQDGGPIHTWIAGGMYVDDEDLDAVAAMRAANAQSPIECQCCEERYAPQGV